MKHFKYLALYSTSLLKPFASSNHGSMMTISALTIVPLIGLFGAAVDYSRTSEAKAKVQSAADSAVLAAAQAKGAHEDKVKAGTKVFEANTSSLAALNLKTTFMSVKDGMRLTVQADQPAAFMSMFGIKKSPFDVVSEAVYATGTTTAGRVEIALALDTTGSMKNDMAALRSAATSLTNTVMIHENVYVSVVPFVASVNVGATNIPMAMMDTQSQSKWHGQFFEGMSAGRVLHELCKPPAPPPPPPPCWDCGGPGDGHIEGSMRSLKMFSHIIHELFGIKSAYSEITVDTRWPLNYYPTTAVFHGQDTGALVPIGFTYSSTGHYCDFFGPNIVSHFDLFNRVTGSKWKGCVEARTSPYDMTDDAPAGSNVETLFVPYFWPDEPDNVWNWGGKGADGWSNNYANDEKDKNYIVKNWAYYSEAAILKYNGVGPFALDETPPATKGPNKSCPDELLRISNKKADVTAKISSLEYYAGGGTIASEGLMWAWRTLSPNAPFADAKPYKDNHKIIVIMSDGINDFSANTSSTFCNWCMPSDYTAYGYMSDHTMYRHIYDGKQFTPTNFQERSKFLDNRLATACTNAKAKGIQIYTVLFRETDPNAVINMKNCATKPSMAYRAANQTDLKNTFEALAKTIATGIEGDTKLLRLTK